MAFFPGVPRKVVQNRRRRLLMAALLGLGINAPALARRYEGYDFDDKLQLGGSALTLNGVGMRAVAVLKGYLAALYLGRSASTPAAVYATPGPKRIRIRMLLDVGTEEFVKAIAKGVRRNCSEAEQAALPDKIEQFNTQLRAVAKVRSKDLIDMDYLPDQGTVISLNGKAIGAAIAGPEFYLALLKVFLGERPVDKRLKAGLLGGAGD